MSRQAQDGGSVLSFTFLDVLMCTMGSLLLLLVVFGVIARKSTRARREGEESRISLAALTQPTAPPGATADAAPESDAPDVGALAQQLEKVRAEQQQLDRLRREAAERRREEQDRIAHIEDHERRLEHDLAKIHIALEALRAAEEKQTVDQEQAAAEAERLKQLVRETEARLEEMRKQGAGDKSYAIVPYKGANGTFRRPVYIECTADAVTIQPEGIRLTVEDFDGPLRSGNPLAAAVRAAHEELNGRAAAAGQTAMPDPYPLLIVRPNGAAAYAAALDAIRSWDSDYGYEFVEASWKLKFPEPDPRLAQVMAHAVDEARQRQALLARVAPRRYGPRLSVGGAGGGGDYGGDGGVGLGGNGGNAAGGGGGGGFAALAGGAGDRIGQRGGNGALGDGREGNPLRGGGGGNFSDEFTATEVQPAGGSGVGGGALTTSGAGGAGVGGAGGATNSRGGAGGQAAAGGGAGDSPRYGSAPSSGAHGAGGAAAGQYAGAATATPGASDAAQAGSGGGGSAGDANGAASAGGGSAAMAGASAGGSSASMGGASGSASTQAANAGAVSANFGGMPSMTMSNARRGSAADKRGANWANADAKRHAAAITRPIRVQVNPDQLLVLDADGRPAGTGAISFQQPVDGVMDGLAAAIQQQIADWGLAGDGMYWRPTLVVSVAPGAERQAQRLAELLDNSGVDVRLPQSTASAIGGTGHATR
jgi:hypothetical protein